MASATNQDAYGQPGWGSAAGTWHQPAGPWGQQQTGGPQGGQGWGPQGAPQWGLQAGPWWGPPPWRAPFLSGPMGIAAMVLGFIFFWPVGLAILFFMLGTGRMGCKRWRRQNGYQAASWTDNAPWGGPWSGWKNWMCGTQAPSSSPSSGNRAFDEYRTETLRRLEEEQKEFGAFLDRLRFARDKSEFDQFMAERRSRPAPPPPGPEGEPSPA
jgi:hypothetical protein